jgi:hypothetical protein
MLPTTLLRRRLFCHFRQLTAKVNYFFSQQPGMLRFLRRDVKKPIAKLRIVHLQGVLGKFFRVLAFVDIALAQNIESHAPRFIANA